MDIGIINPKYVTTETGYYGIDFNSNMLGLAPMVLLSTPTVPSELDKR